METAQQYKPDRVKDDPSVVGIIVPIYKIGPILADTIQSLLNQKSERIDLRLLLIIDGCPFHATLTEQLTDYLYGSDIPIEICRKKNEGVSVARNFGVNRLLSRFPEVEYILFFDADDLIPPNYIETSITALNSSQAKTGKKTGWAYTDQFQFGAATQWVQYPRSIMSSRFFVNNLSQPTSLVTRELVDAGARFDESLRAGIEDWEFWLNATNLGYHGAYAKDTYLKYRRLAGSRSSVNRANDAYTKFYLRTKHAQNFQARSLLKIEAREAPRYAVWDPQEKNFTLRTTPGGKAHSVLGMQDLIKAYLARQRYRNPDAYIDDPYFPDLIVVGDTKNPDLFGALLHAEERLVTDGAAIASFIVNWRDEAGKKQPWIGVLRVSRLLKKLHQAPHAASSKPEQPLPKGGNKTFFRRLRSLFSPRTAVAPHTEKYFTSAFEESRAAIYAALHDASHENADIDILKEAKKIEELLDDELAPLKKSRYGSLSEKISVVGNPRSTHWDISEEAIGVKHLYPWLPNETHDALLGVVGGDASIAYAAKHLEGIREHNSALAMHWFAPRFLCAPGKRDYSFFDSVTQLIDHGSTLQKHKGRLYNGAPLFETATRWRETVTNFLSACDFVFNVGCIEATPGISALKKYGLKKAYFYFHSGDDAPKSRYNDAIICEHLIAYLGVYKKILVDDEEQALRLQALGAPRSVISLINSAPSQSLFSSD